MFELGKLLNLHSKQDDGNITEYFEELRVSKSFECSWDTVISMITLISYQYHLFHIKELGCEFNWYLS